jgi:hypothetical protein
MSSNPLKAQYARVRQAEDRHAEKLKAKAAKSSAGASSSAARQPTYTKTIMATADKAAARRAALAAAEGPNASVRVRKNDGTTMPMANALYQIQSFLKVRRSPLRPHARPVAWSCLTRPRLEERQLAHLGCL